MSEADLPALIGAVGGAIGAFGGVGGLGVALVARRDSRRAADASGRSADEAEKVSRIESDRQHDDLMPPPPARIDSKLRDGSLFGSITVTRDYRVKAVGVYSTGGSHPLGLSLLLRAHQPEEFQIEPWPPGMNEPKTRVIRFRFWPPVEADDVAPWSCRCDRPTGDDTNGDGHWEWAVPIKKPLSGQLVF